jgi:hypothetical protein
VGVVDQRRRPVGGAPTWMRGDWGNFVRGRHRASVTGRFGAPTCWGVIGIPIVEQEWLAVAEDRWPAESCPL